MKLGIIGSGTIVQEFLPVLKKIEGIELLGILGTARSAELVRGLCRDYQIPCAADSLEVLCAAGVDTVYAAVPNFLHFEYCKQALEKGLHVIVEKPITSNEKEALRLKELAEAKKCFLFEAISTLYLGNYKKIREWLPRLGAIKLVQSQFNQYSRRYDAFKNGEVLPAFDPAKSGGALMDLNLYNLHFVMGLFGTPKTAVYYANIEREIDTSGVVVLQYPEFPAVCIAAKDSRGMCGSIIQGTEGCIKTSAPPSLIGEIRLELNNGTVERYDDGSANVRAVLEFTEFVRAIKERDYDFCYKKLEQSIAVSRVQTEVRKRAGILFPADQEMAGQSLK